MVFRLLRAELGEGWLPIRGQQPVWEGAARRHSDAGAGARGELRKRFWDSWASGSWWSTNQAAVSDADVGMRYVGSLLGKTKTTILCVGTIAPATIRTGGRRSFPLRGSRPGRACDATPWRPGHVGPVADDPEGEPDRGGESHFARTLIRERRGDSAIDDGSGRGSLS